MKGGGILGGIGGLLGVGLLSKGAMRGGTSLLGTLVSGLSGGRGGMGGRGGGMGGGRGGQSSLAGGMGGGCRCGGHGGMGDDNALGELLQQALQHFASQPQARAVTDNDASCALPKGQSDTVIDVAAVAVPAADTEQQQEALALLAGCVASYVPGRARLRHEDLKNDASYTELRRALLDAGFHEVELKASTGSALLTWDAEAWDKAAFLAAALPLGLYLLKRERTAA
ncbi:MAG: hypothetical protein IJU65_01760 [Desulfovibrio sp.]|nr:hypothetical protein [Desulfovibrio sp.]